MSSFDILSLSRPKVDPVQPHQLSPFLFKLRRGNIVQQNEIARPVAIHADFFEGVGDNGRHPGAAGFAGYVRETVSYGLTFHFEPQAVYDHGLRAAGFVDLEFIDHCGPSTEISRRDLKRLAGPEGERVKSMLGDDMFATRMRASTFRNKALESGGLQHFHMRARRPG